MAGCARLDAEVLEVRTASTASTYPMLTGRRFAPDRAPTECGLFRGAPRSRAPNRPRAAGIGTQESPLDDAEGRR